jgi:hypothetical protein
MSSFGLIESALFAHSVLLYRRRDSRCRAIGVPGRALLAYMLAPVLSERNCFGNLLPALSPYRGSTSVDLLIAILGSMQ